MQDPHVRVMPPERWDRLLRAAAKEFAQAGYERASLNRIIRECGLSKSSFYHYVDSKEQLFDHVLLTYGPPLIEALKLPDDAALAADFWAALDGIVVRLLELGAQDSIYGLIGRMCYLPDAPSGGDSALGRGFALVLAWLEHAIDVGRASRAVRDDLPAELQARALLAVARVFDEWSLNHMPADTASQQGLLTVQLAALHRLIMLDQPVHSA